MVGHYLKPFFRVGWLDRKQYFFSELEFGINFYIGIVWYSTDAPIANSFLSEHNNDGTEEGGIGAEGAAMARFVHFKDPLEAKYGKLDKKHLTGVIIMGKANHRVRLQFRMCYECQIPDINNHQKFIIICTNFKVTKAPANPFEDEVAPMHTPGNEEDPDHASNINENNIFTLNCGATSDDIAELRAQGIEWTTKTLPPRTQ
jgi:hypothetical protein